jgi:hypothetical protein
MRGDALCMRTCCQLADGSLAAAHAALATVDPGLDAAEMSSVPR